MKIGGKQMEMRDHRYLLNIAISKAIDQVLEENNYRIEPSIINLALCDVIKGNIENQIKIIYETEDELED